MLLICVGNALWMNPAAVCVCVCLCMCTVLQAELTHANTNAKLLLFLRSRSRSTLEVLTHRRFHAWLQDVSDLGVQAH